VCVLRKNSLKRGANNNKKKIKSNTTDNIDKLLKIMAHSGQNLGYI
jgi:hypothetical protein